MGACRGTPGQGPTTRTPAMRRGTTRRRSNGVLLARLVTAVTDPTPLTAALAARRPLLDALHAERTDCYRLLHGVVEGVPGLTIDRYGPVLLVQTWRDRLTLEQVERWAEEASEAIGEPLLPVWNHRSKPIDYPRWHPVELPTEIVGTELGLRYDVRPRHRGMDPLLFLDLRAVRRRIRAEADGRSVLNLFAYTGGVGLAAAAGGATEVLNVDFAASALDVARANADANELAEMQRFFVADCLPVMRQLAGMKVGRRTTRFPVVPRRSYDLIVLDPPRWSKGPFGAVDVVRDYPSLFKPCVLTANPGGTIIATNHVASVDVDEWCGVLRRCAEKAGRPLADLEVVTPEADFPSPDARPPLKVAWCRLP